MNRPILSSAALLLFSGFAAAQGANDCGSAQPIAGYGSWPVDTTNATTDGPPISCGSLVLHNDVWFAWTAPATEAVLVSTCLGATFDTTMAAYDGTACPPSTEIGCNDDSCGAESTLFLDVAAGSTYLIRVGGFSSFASGTATMDIQLDTLNCDTPSTGPDVIVGDLNGIMKYAPQNGIAAYALGTTSCNVGDQGLSWVQSTNQHPVIAQNIYRLEDGRFEQMGMSWLKHGFTALQQSLCCDCTSSGSGAILGVGCSDPYSPSLNGSQPTLGPRSEVNPFRGHFPFPFSTQGQGGNSIFKRIQVANDDIDPALHPAATFYGEGQYVSPDDAAAGNQFNNASWRPLEVGDFTNGSWTLSLGGETHRREAAIHAWRAADPTVHLQEAVVPGDGLFIVGSDVTDLGGGIWHYEYAVHNQVSQRGCGSFRVPIPPGATVTNVGFHDVDYHSGEPFSGADWQSHVLPDRVQWETEPFATNPDANALRWGTLYNFRFDADVPPAASHGAVTLGLFEPGTPHDTQVRARIPEGAGALGTSYCGPAVANSTGQPGVMSATGSDVAADNDLMLTASELPPHRFGFLLCSDTQGYVAGHGGSSGNLCLGGSIGRFAPQVTGSGAHGSISVVPDLMALPTSPAQAVLAGETWNWQVWYRDSGASSTSNFTDGRSILFH